MSRTGQLEPFETETQTDLFGAQAEPAYRPDPDKVRSRLHKILAEARVAQFWPKRGWRTTCPGSRRPSCSIAPFFPQMTRRLPEDEGTQLRFAFDTEMARLEAA
jgi:hypothetical protein